MEVLETVDTIYIVDSAKGADPRQAGWMHTLSTSLRIQHCLMVASFGIKNNGCSDQPSAEPTFLVCDSS